MPSHSEDNPKYIQAYCGAKLIPQPPRIMLTVHRDRLKVPMPLRKELGCAATRVASWPFLLSGGVGTGKTCSALSYGDLWPFAGYYTMQGLCSDVMNRSKDIQDSTNEVERLCQSSKCRLVILDEIAQRKNHGDLESSILYQVLDAQAQKQFPLIVIANASVDELTKRYDKRIMSRLMSGAQYRMTGPDLRRNG